MVWSVSWHIHSSGIKRAHLEDFIVVEEFVEDAFELAAVDIVSLAEGALDLSNPAPNAYERPFCLLFGQAGLEVGSRCNMIGMRMSLQDHVHGIAHLRHKGQKRVGSRRGQSSCIGIVIQDRINYDCTESRRIGHHVLPGACLRLEDIVDEGSRFFVKRSSLSC